jgi:hypothetical protein
MRSSSFSKNLVWRIVWHCGRELTSRQVIKARNSTENSGGRSRNPGSFKDHDLNVSEFC